MSSGRLGKRDPVITGVGVVSPVGLTAEDLWTALTHGRYGISSFTFSEGASASESTTVPSPLKIAAPAREFTGALDNFGALPSELARSLRKGLKLMCRESQMAVAAALRALQDAGWQPDLLPADRCGVIFGCDHLLTIPEEFVDAVRACTENGHFRFSRWGQDGLGRMTPLWLLKYLPNMPASHIAIYCQFCGPSNSITLREASGLVAIGEAARLIGQGHVDLMVVGATGYRLHPMRVIHALTQEQIVTDGDPQTACRPFDRHRQGQVLGEGAAAVVIEAYESAQRRSCDVYAKVEASAAGCKVESTGKPDLQSALRRTLELLLARSQFSPTRIGFISAQASGTRAGDRAEAQAIASVFGPGKSAPPVVAAKTYTGHMGSSSAVAELIAGLLALRRNHLYPISNYTTPDDECPVNVVRDADIPAGDSFIQLAVTPQAQAAGVLLTRC